MATYKVKGGQTLFDVALHLYGTIEGLFDLLISNPQISMTTDLVAGMELEYHTEFIINQGIVDKFASEDMEIINGERHVYHKPTSEELRAIIRCPEDVDCIELVVSGEGTIVMDWGDNSDLEYIELTNNKKLLSHYFDNNVDERRVKIYGQFTLKYLNTTRMDGDLYLTKPMIVDEFECKSNDNSIIGLFLFEGTYSVNLQYMVVPDLIPLYDMSLETLDLRGIQPTDVHALTNYLVYLKENYGQRRACKVYLSTEPSTEGMAAIQTIINEPEWNTPVAWEFHINDEILTYTPTDGTDTD